MSGLLLRAANDFNIDLSQSYMIGDDDRDVQAGQNAGCKESVKIDKNKSNALTEAIKKFVITR